VRKQKVWKTQAHMRKAQMKKTWGRMGLMKKIWMRKRKRDRKVRKKKANIVW